MVNINKVNLIDLLPPSIKKDSNTIAAAQALNIELKKVLTAMQAEIIIPNISTLPESVIDLLAWQYHVDFYDSSLPIESKRALVLRSVDWHKRKGTKSAVEEVVSAAFEPSKVLEWFEYGGAPYCFKVQTEDVTTDPEHLKRFRNAVDSVKNTRSWLEKIEFLLHLIDEIKLDETTQLRVGSFNYEAYPWTGRMADGSCSFIQGATFNSNYYFNSSLHADACLDGDEDAVQLATIYDGAIIADGKRQFSINPTRKILFNAQEIETLSGFSINETGYSEEWLTSNIFSGSFAADGTYHFGHDAGPTDNGGDLVVTVGRKFDGTVTCSAGSTRFFNGIYHCDGSANFQLDNKRAPLFSGLFLCDGSKRFMQGGEYFATYRYSDQL